MYPDSMAFCGEPEFYKNRKDVIVTLHWILTESTERNRHLEIGNLLTLTLEEVYDGIL